MTPDTDLPGSLPPAAGAGSFPHRPLVLVVEDEADTRDAISVILFEAGFDVVDAQSGFAALERARCVRPDLILLDLGLPELNGLDVARLLNNDSVTSGIPILALTGSWLAEQPGSLLSAGFLGALRKPFRAPELVALVRSVLQNHPHFEG